MNVRSNFNILQEYIYVLTMFKTWEAYSKLLLARVNENRAFMTEESLFKTENSDRN
jgi:hypothetical protein